MAGEMRQDAIPKTNAAAWLGSVRAERENGLHANGGRILGIFGHSRIRPPDH